MFLRCGTKRRNDRIRPFIRFPDDGAPSVRDGGCGTVGLCEELHSATKTRKTAIASGSDEVVPWRRRTVVGSGPCGNDACRWAPESGMRLCRMSKVPSGKRQRYPKGASFSEACRSCCGKPSRSEGMRIASYMRKPFLPSRERSDRFRVCSPLRRKARSSRNRSCAVPFRGRGRFCGRGNACRRIGASLFSPAAFVGGRYKIKRKRASIGIDALFFVVCGFSCPEENYFVIRFSHLSIENMTVIEIRQTTTNVPHVSQMGIVS